MKADGKKIEAKGFTLIEVIAGLILLSVMAAMILPRGGTWRSAQSVSDCQSLFKLQKQMEQIVQTYKQQLAIGGGSVDLATFQAAVVTMPYVDAIRTGYLTEAGSVFSVTPSTTNLFLVTLVQGDQSIGSIFSQ